MLTPPPLVLPGGRSLTFERARVMGVLNVTPDSFSDGGRYLDLSSAVSRGVALVMAGADVIDVGGESTRPGAASVAAETQIARVIPVIEALAAQLSRPISIDTTSAVVARAALDAGAAIVNDISAGRFDPEMLPLGAARGVPFVAMHTRAPPAVMQADPRYGDVVEEVIAHLAERVARCVEAGLPPAQVIVDPGIGFGKRLTHNLRLLQAIPRIAALGHAVLVGTSRKRFLGELTGRPVAERVMATAGSCAAAVALGAHVVRVHDVAEIGDAIRVAAAIAAGRGDVV